MGWIGTNTSSCLPVLPVFFALALGPHPGVPCTISHRQLEMESSDIGNSFRRSSVHQAFAFGLSAEPAEPPPRPLQRRAPQTGERSGDRHRPIVVVGVRYRVLGEAKRFGGNG